MLSLGALGNCRYCGPKGEQGRGVGGVDLEISGRIAVDRGGMGALYWPWGIAKATNVGNWEGVSQRQFQMDYILGTRAVKLELQGQIKYKYTEPVGTIPGVFPKPNHLLH